MQGAAADPKITPIVWYRPLNMTEHAMQSAYIEPRGGGGRSGLFLLFRCRYRKGEDIRQGT
jgi:hypothetical protein